MNVFKRCLLNYSSKKFTIIRHSSGGLYEPSYLEAMKSKFPLYDSMNIHLRSYDYPVLESYQKFLHKLLKHTEIEVDDCWALPAQHIQIHTYKPNSELINSEYKLKLYERVIQMEDVSSLQMPIILRMVEASLPAGVTAQVRPFEESDEENRFIPDKELETLKEELDNLGGPSKKK